MGGLEGQSTKVHTRSGLEVPGDSCTYCRHCEDYMAGGESGQDKEACSTGGRDRNK